MSLKESLKAPPHLLSVPFAVVCQISNEIGPLFIHMSCAITCLLLSATYHLLSAYSSLIQAFFSRLDYSGIAILITGSAFPPIIYGFACSPGIKYTYLSLISSFCALAFIVTLLPNTDKPQYRRLRGILFIAVGLLAGAPAIHSAISNDPNILVKLFYWAMGGIVYVSGALLYVARIPERCAPGKFDFFVLI